MSFNQEHFGKKFYCDTRVGYWISTTCPKISAHRWVWMNIHGVIPKGYHIHHKDENKSNNSIENLELIEASRHLKHHSNQPLRKEWARKLVDKIRPLTKEWHASDEGRAWHKLHAIKNGFGKWEPKKHDCNYCGTAYETSKRSGTSFCSNKCKAANRRKSCIDNIECKCERCDSIFTKNKYAKTRFCSKSCSKRKSLILL